MTNNNVYRAISKAFKQINDQVESTKHEDELDAKEVIKFLGSDGGGIDVIEEPFSPTIEHLETIQEKTPEYNHSYGIDGSTTKELVFNDGLMVAAAVGKAGVSQKQNIPDSCQTGSVCVTTYFDQADLSINDPNIPGVDFEHTSLPNVMASNKKIYDWLTSIGRTQSESKRFNAVAQDIDNSPIFIDGPLYPAELFTWILHDQDNSIAGTPMEDMSEIIIDIMQTYIDSIEICIRDQIPVFGFQKSTTATRVLDALEEKKPEIVDELTWVDDAKLFNDALSHTQKGEMISYSPWYIENEVDVGRSRVEPLKNYDKLDLKYGDYESYKRAFFFVKPPNRKTVFRVGTPYEMIGTKYDMNELRYIVLNEVGIQRKEPPAISLADEKARIGLDLRDEFRRFINSGDFKSRNEERGSQYMGDD